MLKTHDSSHRSSTFVKDSHIHNCHVLPANLQCRLSGIYLAFEASVLCDERQCQHAGVVRNQDYIQLREIHNFVQRWAELRDAIHKHPATAFFQVLQTKVHSNSILLLSALCEQSSKRQKLWTHPFQQRIIDVWWCVVRQRGEARAGHRWQWQEVKYRMC